MAHIKNIFDRKKWLAIFFLWFIHGLVAFVGFNTSDFFEFSIPYVSISLLLFLWIFFVFTLSVFYIKDAPLWNSLEKRINKPNIKDFLFLTSFLLIFIRIGLWYVRGLAGNDLALQIGGYLDILQPVLDMLAYVALEAFLTICAININHYAKSKINFREFLVRLLFILSILGLLVFIISKTGLGIMSSYKGDWQRGLPAVPLLEWQIVFAGLCGLGMLAVEKCSKALKLHHSDLLICILIWAGTSIVWLSQPVIPNPSALTPREPNFEIYPFIDSQTYDEAAQSILIGNGFGKGQIPQRPLYIAFLSFAHILGGQDYNHLIFFQSLIFAFFPVLLYLLGRDLFGRPLGISIALLALLRDYTSNIVSPFTGNLSYSKVYLSEIPTAMFLIFFLILGIRWIRSGFSVYLGFLLGGLLGTAMLIRTQTIVLIPVIVLFSMLSRSGNIRPMIKGSIFMLLTTLIVVSPWLWRNWKITGGVIFDNPESQTMNLALRYSRVNGIDWQVERLPGETSIEFSARLKQIAVDAVLSNPAGATLALVNSFLNHGVNNILLFPLRNEIRNLNELIYPEDAFWEKWEGTPTPFQTIVLGFYIFLFGFGITIAWSRNGWLGLLPLGLNMAYNLWTSLALLSGQRFMLTMDWSIYLYYMLGIFYLIGGLLFIVNKSRAWIIEWIENNSFQLDISSENVKWPKFLLAAICFFGIGLSLPLAENIFPDKYPRLSHRQLIASLSASSALENSSVDPACVVKLANDGQLSIVQGRALYPRYYTAGDGESFTDTPGYKNVNEGRLVFDIIGQASMRIIFPMSQSPDFFPHASDVTLVYNQDKELWFVVVKQNISERFYISDKFDRSLCDK